LCPSGGGQAVQKKEFQMDEITQQLMQQLAGEGLSQIGRKVGVNQQQAGSALSAAIPLLVSALANNASQSDGSQALHQALTQDHDGSVLDDMPAYLSNPEAANGAGILKHVLGSQQPVVAQGLARGTGLDSNQVVQLLQIAAPLVMGMLGRQQQQQGLDPDNLSSFLGSQQQVAQQANPDLMGTLNTLLDLNQDGSALDDVAGLMSKLLGG
jgi:hypothetical protein